MAFKKKSSNWEPNYIKEPDADYYLHLIIENAIKAPLNALENNSPLSNAWAIMEMCAYQIEVFAWAKNIIDNRDNDSDYIKAIEKEKNRSNINIVADRISIENAKLANFKIAYILREYEGKKPDIDEGDIPSKFFDDGTPDDGDAPEDDPEV